MKATKSRLEIEIAKLTNEQRKELERVKEIFKSIEIKRKNMTSLTKEAYLEVMTEEESKLLADRPIYIGNVFIDFIEDFYCIGVQ